MTRLPALFEALLGDEPGLPALIQGGRTTTFAQWWADSSVIASALAARGTGRGDILALMLPSGQDFASCYLAALRLGAIASGVNPRLGPTEVGHVLARCAPAVVLTDEPQRVPAAPGRRVLTPGQARGFLAGAAPSITGWPPQVARVAVVGAPAPVIGEVGVAFVVPREPGGPPAEADLRAWCRIRIADYKVPDIVVIASDLPVHATFKVDTRQLKATAADLARARARDRKQQA